MGRWRRVLGVPLVTGVFLEHLGDKRQGGIAANVLDQQVNGNDRQLFGVAWAIGAVCLSPFGLDVSVYGYDGHKISNYLRGWKGCGRSRFPGRHDCGGNATELAQ